MPTPCSIPGCRTNRTKNDPGASVFCFPKDSVRRAQWEWAVRQLHDSTYTFREGSKICIRHFETEFIEREHRAVRDDGTILTIPRKAATLRDTAVPTLFDFLPDPYPNGTRLPRRRSRIASLHVLKKEIEWRLKEELQGWHTIYDEDLPALSIYKIAISEDFEPEIRVSVTFNAQLVVKIVHPDVTLPDVDRALGDGSTCDDWDKLSRLIRLLNGEQPLEKKKCRMKVFETGDVVVLEISQEESSTQDERFSQDESVTQDELVVEDEHVTQDEGQGEPVAQDEPFTVGLKQVKIEKDSPEEYYKGNAS